MSFLSSLLEAVVANEALDAFGDYRSKKRQAKEQQRITTVSLILIAIVNALKKGVMTTNDDTLVLRIEDFLVDKYDKTERKVRLKPFRDDCVAFDRLIYKAEEDYIPESKVTINYRYFYDRIVNYKELNVDELFHAVNCLEIIDIELEPQHGDNPQLIFESLNSTGLDLTESDKPCFSSGINNYSSYLC